jgi:hypothetical protein
LIPKHLHVLHSNSWLYNGHDAIVVGSLIKHIAPEKPGDVAITGTNVKRAFVYAARECVLRHYQRLKTGEPVATTESEPAA